MHFFSFIFCSKKSRKWDAWGPGKLSPSFCHPLVLFLPPSHLTVNSITSFSCVTCFLAWKCCYGMCIWIHCLHCIANSCLMSMRKLSPSKDLRESCVHLPLKMSLKRTSDAAKWFLPKEKIQTECVWMEGMKSTMQSKSFQFYWKSCVRIPSNEVKKKRKDSKRVCERFFHLP